MSLDTRGANGTATELDDDTTTAGRVAMVLGGALAVLGVVADPRLLAAGLVVWFLYALYAVVTG